MGDSVFNKRHQPKSSEFPTAGSLLEFGAGGKIDLSIAISLKRIADALEHTHVLA